MTRLGLIPDDAFEKYMEEGGFVQELHHDTGYLVPLHEFSFVLPHDGTLHNDVKYQIYTMFASFVRTKMIQDKDTFIAANNQEDLFTLRVMKHYFLYEDVKCFLKTNNYGDADYYDILQLEVFENDEDI